MHPVTTPRVEIEDKKLEISPDGALVGWIHDKMGSCVSSTDEDAPAFP